MRTELSGLNLTTYGSKPRSAGLHRRSYGLSRLEENLLRLPFARAFFFPGEALHQSDQFALCADTAHPAFQFGLRVRLDPMPVTDLFDLVGVEFHRFPVAQGFCCRDEV